MQDMRQPVVFPFHPWGAQQTQSLKFHTSNLKVPSPVSQSLKDLLKCVLKLCWFLPVTIWVAVPGPCTSDSLEKKHKRWTNLLLIFVLCSDLFCYLCFILYQFYSL